MTSQPQAPAEPEPKPEPQIVLYDLACIKNVCFSPVVWRIRLMLNYKRIPYRTVFLEFPDIEPTLKGLGVVPPVSAPGTPSRYTVPTIHHLPSNTFLMDSAPIAAFIESTYPSPPVPLTSDLGKLIETNARTVGARAFRTAVMPREVRILCPRSQEYFRSKREAALGHRLEDLLEHEEEEWSAVDKDMTAQGELMLTNQAKGPFVLGEKPSYTDFFLAGNLQSARVIDEGVFQRLIRYPGYGEIYNAFEPYMEKKD